MGKAGNAGQETSKQGCERNDGGEPGDGARLEITFAVRRERERERERTEEEEEEEEGTNILISKRKRKKKDLQLNILKNPSLY